jgi:hypothetical protein
MTDSAKRNTDWINTWAMNPDEGDYREMVRISKGDNAAVRLEEYATNLLKNAPEGTGTFHTHAEMTPSDYDTVDWQEIADSLATG